MTNSRNKPNQQILDEAAEWFVDFREGDLDARAEQAFMQWLRRSPEHIGAYMEVAAFWAEVPSLVAKEDVDVSVLIAYARAEENIVPLGGARLSRGEDALAADSVITARPSVDVSPSVSRGGWRRWGLLAACFTVTMIGLSWWSIAEHQTYRTAVGEQRSVLLADGSTIELNAKSRVRVHFTEKVRDIALLEGQALFRVAKDPARPLVVTSGDASVRAVGTQFDVNRRKNGTTVTVIEGRVSVTNLPVPISWVNGFTATGSSTEIPAGATASDEGGSASVLLLAGQQLVVKTKTPLQPKPADIPVATAWTRRQIIFQGASLAEVVDEFNRYNPRQMKITDETLQSVRISGVFSSTEPVSLLLFLKDQVLLDVTEDDEGIRISRSRHVRETPE